MSTTGPTVEGIDHVALDVADDEQAADWYERVLGLERLEAFRSWAEGAGPLVVSSDGGDTMLALFENDAGEYAPRHVAFRTDGPGLFEFVDALAAEPTVDVGGRDALVDHRLSYSVYVTDPDGHDLEVTTYDYEYVDDRT